MKISNRLTRVASNVTPGYNVADIGTDHGYVPIYLMKNRLAKHVIAMDINEGPLKHARDNIIQNGLEKCIELRLSDGFNELKPGEAQIAVMAGMGGELMKKLLIRGSSVAEKLEEMVLSPHSEIYLVREYVQGMGHRIVDEEMLMEEGKYYTIIKTKAEKDSRRYSQAEYQYGAILIERKDQVLLKYLEKKREKYLSILKNLEKGNTRYAEIVRELEEIEGIEKKME